MANLLDALKSYWTRAKENVATSTAPYRAQPSKIITQGIPNLVKSAAKTAYEAPRDLGEGFVKSFQAKQDADRLLDEAKNDAAISQKNIQKAIELKKAGNIAGYKSLLTSNNKPQDKTKAIDEFIKNTEAEKGKTIVAGVKTAGLLPNVFNPGVGSYIASALLSAGMGTVAGEDPFTAAGKGLTQAKQYGLVTQFSNPLIRQVGSSVGGQFANPLVREASYRTISGLGNVAENEILGRTELKTPSNKDRATSFLVGAAMGGKYKGEDKREVNFTTLLKTELKRGDNFKLDPKDAARLKQAMLVAGKTYKDLEPSLKKAVEPITDPIKYPSLTPTEIKEVKNFESQNRGKLVERPDGSGYDLVGGIKSVDFGKEKDLEKYNFLLKKSQDAGLKQQSGAIDLGAEVSIGKGKNVNPEASSEVTKAKTTEQPAETTEVLPWEQPDYRASTSLEGIEQSRTTPKPSVEGKVQPTVETQNLKATQNSLPPPAIKEVKDTGKAVGKVNLIDWLRTPDRVMKKIGLGKEAELLKTKYNDYLEELPKNIDRITSWYEQVKGSPDASKRLFQYLDGQKVELSPQEMKVASEMQAYLKEWADRLDLPYDKRIASYITHIFEPDFIKKDFDEDLAKIISEKVPGSVYDPFLQQRLGKQGYVEDVFRALDAYTKRATRKVHMDEALAKVETASNKLDLDSWKYVKSYTDRINLRPTQIDNYLDNLIKQTPIGYKLGSRPTAAVSRFLRQTVYRGTLGLNIGSAVRNLTQGVNTYAKLGAKYTLMGYMKAMRSIATGADELVQSGVLRDTTIQDRKLSAVKGFLEKADKGLFSFFDMAEKINRGSAYFGAKAKYLAEGLSEKEAIKKAVALTRDTQFTFGSIDTPVAMQGDLVKFLTQFQSFNVKQGEFVSEMVKNKEFKGLARWIGANLALTTTVGGLIGIDYKDMIPFYNNLTGESKLGETPPIKLAKGVIQAVNKSPDEYGNVPQGNVLQRIAENKNVTGSIPAFIPAGVQAKKTIEGVKAYSQGASTSKSGRVRYPIEPGVGNAIRSATFGQYNVPGAKEYFDTKQTPLGEKQSQEFLSLKPEEKKAYYDSVKAQRQTGNEEDKIYEAITKGDYAVISNSTPKVSAEAIYRYINKQDKGMRQEAYNQLKDRLPQQVKDELRAIQKLDSQGVGKKDRDIMLIPQEIRARAVFDRIMELDTKNRQKKYDQLVEMGIITPSMKPILQKLIQETKK